MKPRERALQRRRLAWPYDRTNSRKGDDAAEKKSVDIFARGVESVYECEVIICSDLLLFEMRGLPESLYPRRGSVTRSVHCGEIAIQRSTSIAPLARRDT